MAQRGRPRKVALPSMLNIGEDLTADPILDVEPLTNEPVTETVAVKTEAPKGRRVIDQINAPKSISAVIDTAVQSTPDAETDPKGYAAYVESLRRTRIPYGATAQKLAYPQRAGYKRHWFNDIGGRVQDHMDRGWTVVNDPKGRPVIRTVGAARDNTPLKAHLMEIPSVFWEEIEAERNAFAKARMDDIKKSPIRAEAGAAKASDKDKFYSPREEVIKVTESLTRS